MCIHKVIITLKQVTSKSKSSNQGYRYSKQTSDSLGTKIFKSAKRTLSQTVQEALPLQRNRVTHLSVEILQLRIITFEKDYNR